MPYVLAASNPTVTAIGTALVAIGVALAVVTVRLWRAAAVDPEVLAPLEVMASRRYARSDDETRVRILNEVRHPGAVRIERVMLEPEPRKARRRHRRSIEEMEAEHQAMHLDVPVSRTDDSREIDLRPSPQPDPEPIHWDEVGTGGHDEEPGGHSFLDPLLHHRREGRESGVSRADGRAGRRERRREDPGSWGEYE